MFVRKHLVLYDPVYLRVERANQRKGFLLNEKELFNCIEEGNFQGDIAEKSGIPRTTVASIIK